MAISPNRRIAQLHSDRFLLLPSGPSLHIRSMTPVALFVDHLDFTYCKTQMDTDGTLRVILGKYRFQTRDLPEIE